MSVVNLSDEARTVVARERTTVAERVEGLKRQSETLRAVVDQVDAELGDAERLLRQMDEMLGLASQLPLDVLSHELRGQRLRDVAVQVLPERRGAEVVIHYTDWFSMLVEAGVRVGGKNPVATFLTQIGKARKAPRVESVRPWSGLYRLTPAA